MLKNHNLLDVKEFKEIIYELRPCLGPDGNPVEELKNAWIFLNNPEQYNSYTTSMVKEIIIALRQASNDRSVVCTVFTGVGDRAFCTGGNTKEYAEYYAGNPQEYMQYMRLFNDMVTTLMHVDKPVICRANGMRIGGGQEIGMACDFTLASDLARFGQAGPKHGSSPVGGSTDFLPCYLGVERAMESATLCEHWSAYKAFRLGIITQVVPALKINGKFIPNPLVITDRWIDEMGQIVYGEWKTGADAAEGKKLLKKGETDLSLLDKAVNTLCTKILVTMPDCMMKTIEEVRKHKLVHWDKNREQNRHWLGLNMMTEAKAGFRAFNEGPKGQREVDFIELRRKLARGEPWSDELIRAISPQYKV